MPVVPKWRHQGVQAVSRAEWQVRRRRQRDTEIPNLIVAVKKKPSEPPKEQAVEEEEKEDEEEKGVSLSQKPSCAPKASLAKRRKIEKDDSADPPVDPPVEEQEENEEEDEEDNVDEEEEEEKEPMEEEEEEDWEEECDRSDEDVKVVAVDEGKQHGEKSKVKGDRAKGWTYMWYMVRKANIFLRWQAICLRLF